MRIIPRAEWGARYGDGRYWTDLPAREMWLHHSVTIAPDLTPPFDDDFAAIRRIEQIGKDRFGTVYGFPYTWGITPVGLIFEGHNVAKTGAHTHGHNTVGRAVVFVGNYEQNKPTRAQIEASAWLLREAHSRGWIASPQFTGGHRDTKATACPGRHAYAAIPEINRLATRPERRYTMVIYTKRGTPDALAALAAHGAAPKGVVTQDLAAAKAALDRGEKVYAVGGPAARDLPGAIEVVGSTAVETGRKVYDLAKGGW